MKLVCDRAKLDEALKAVAPLAKAKNKIPVLAHIQIVAQDGVLNCAATDLDAYCEAGLPADVTENGGTLVRGEQFMRLVSSLPPGTHVEVTADDKSLSIRCGKASYKLPTLPLVDWPEFQDATAANEFTLSAEQIKRLFGIPEIAIEAGSSPRLYLSGCYLHQDGPDLVSVATNGKQLLKCSEPLDAALADGVIVPRESVHEILRLATSDIRIKASCGSLTFRSKLVNAAFPDYARVIPDLIPDTAIAVDRKELTDAVKRLSLVGGETQTVRLTWQAGGSDLEISAWRGDGDGSEMIPAQIDHAANGYIAFAIRFLLPVLEALEGEVIELRVTGKGDACRLVDRSTAQVTALVMAVEV